MPRKQISGLTDVDTKANIFTSENLSIASEEVLEQDPVQEKGAKVRVPKHSPSKKLQMLALFWMLSNQFLQRLSGPKQQDREDNKVRYLPQPNVRSFDIPHPASKNYLEISYYEVVWRIYHSINRLSLNKLSLSFTSELCDSLDEIIQDLHHLPEERFKVLIAVIDSLSLARNELRLARFLFRTEEINPLYRLVLRNKATLRGKNILRKALTSWPLQDPVYNASYHFDIRYNLAGDATTDAPPPVSNPPVEKPKKDKKTKGK